MAPNTEIRPPVSIVVASYNSARTIEHCLAALAPQCRPETAEVLVVDSGADGAAECVEASFPWVRLIRSKRRLYPGGARNLGVEQARGGIIAFVDADCIAADDWVRQIVEAHSNPAAVIGGVIANARANSVIDWAAYFCSFHLWMPGTPAGPVPDIPTCCLSVKRWAFDRYGPFRAEGYSSDTEFNWAVVRGGDSVVLEPKIQVGHIAHSRSSDFGARLFLRGRSFAQVCVRAQQLSWLDRMGRILRAPLVPFVLLGRLCYRAWTAPSPYRQELLAAAPWVLAGYGFWSAGELVGYASRQGRKHFRVSKAPVIP